LQVPATVPFASTAVPAELREKLAAVTAAAERKMTKTARTRLFLLAIAAASFGVGLLLTHLVLAR
jgi:hypothetical protein